ncbi:MAG TPA: 30S ribosomal protein S1 [Acidobacteriota bacterium]|nr:30S ribosomal protein S1 [Acidobacteriota bacterium]HNT16529.1 30S ribosomal protein S1 [Acidobacteriota bacterium]
MTSEERKDTREESKKTSASIHPLELTSANIDETGPIDMSQFLEIPSTDSMEHQLLKGRVVAVTETDVLVDVGLKSEGIIAIEEFTTPRGEILVKPGDQIEVFLERMEDANGYVVLSKVKAQKMKAWEEVENAFKENRAIKGVVLDRVKGGLAVDVGVRAFLPGSLADIQPVRNLRALRGQEYEMKVIKVNRKRGNIVLSRKAFLEERMSGQKDRLIEAKDSKKPIKGFVKNITNFGVFVDLGGIDGLLHVTDMSWRRVAHPSELFKVGDEIDVLVLDYDEENNKLQLGMKQLEPSPWGNIEEKFPPGSRVKGKVISLTNYGAFVELEPGIEGMIHVSEMSWTKKIKNPSSLVNIGDEVEVAVLQIDKDSKRISLGLKQIEEDPWETIKDSFAVGDIIEGKVKNITEFGVFIEVLPDVDGLVHISDLSWRRIAHPSELYKKGDQVEAKITNIDVVNKRISLSIKDVLPDVWEKFFTSHSLNESVEGAVTKIVDFGAFVDLGDGVEGLVHISELSEDHIEDPSQVVEVGKAYSFKLIRMDRDEKRIGLSLKENRPVEEEPKSSDKPAGKDGRVSLGDIFDLSQFQKKDGE